MTRSRHIAKTILAAAMAARFVAGIVDIPPPPQAPHPIQASEHQADAAERGHVQKPHRSFGLGGGGAKRVKLSAA